MTIVRYYMSFAQHHWVKAAHWHVDPDPHAGCNPHYHTELPLEQEQILVPPSTLTSLHIKTQLQ